MTTRTAQAPLQAILRLHRREQARLHFITRRLERDDVGQPGLLIVELRALKRFEVRIWARG